MVAESVDTVVVGGGAAGMTAAISTGRSGRTVALFEANSRLGRKILISGNGRCNLTNLDADSTAHYHGSDPTFVRPSLRRFPLAATLDFFQHLGVEVKEEKRGRLFPVSDQARAVVDLLMDEMQSLGVTVCTDSRVTGLRCLEEGKGFVVDTAIGSWRCRHVVMSSGGVSLAKLGADASGMETVQVLGHTSTPLLPGLVPLVCRDRQLRRMHGVKVWAEVRADMPHAQLVDTDDLLFTKYGVSGFTILNLSAQVVPALGSGPVELKVNFFPGHSPEQVSDTLRRRWQAHPHRSLGFSFSGLLASKIVDPLLDKLELDSDRRVAVVTKAERWMLAQALTTWTVLVEEPRPFDYAEVTIGGIRTDEIDPETLESRLVPGLYLTGEMVDIHGDLGGYNFQWAWSSGAVAGQGLVG